MTEQPDDPKIIVDEDWKAQVQQEKEQLEKTSSEPDASDLPPLPEASVLSLLQMLGAQAMSCLGVMPDPTTGEPHVNRPMAKHFIDLIAVVQEKTQGNLSEDETAHIRDALHQLRMVYVSTSSQAESGSEGGPSIELP